MMHSLRCAFLVLGAMLCVSAAVGAQGVKIDGDTFGGLEARPIGPASMSGRVAAIEAVAGDRLTVYAGTAGGGLWKSVDGGLQFKPIFDKYNQSIGAIAIDPSNPKTLWVGTGETWVRNSVSVGDGVYRSTDGGENWSRLGLADTERIARIIVHPKDASTVFVCATGHLYDDHADRGVYRTKDGGTSWDKVLYVAPDVGCGDLAMDPESPNTMYAGMWQMRRTPYFFTSGGPKSGFYRSTDGGSTWQPIKNGMPAGDLGRIAIAISPSKPNIVYATVEAKKTALYRSDDHGETWTQVNDSSLVNSRPFYFSRMLVDPLNPHRIYKMGQIAAVSNDGGKTFSGLGGMGMYGSSYHSDVHDFWVNPKNTEQLLAGTDGGVYVSQDRGATWRFVGSLPVGQFYHVSFDMEFPFNVYGGLQDNSSWFGPSRRSGGIPNRLWQSLSGGDGFWAFADPTDTDTIYDEIQGGNLFRIRRSTLESKDISPSPQKGEPKYRFNWNTPIHMSPTKSGTMYYAAQFLFRSSDKGESWERTSPDLTTNDPAKQQQTDSGGLTPDNSTAENHCTIFAIGESPSNGSVIWVGTDDGNLQVTSDGGKTWTNVVAHVPGLPRNTWVSSVEPSHFGEAAAYVTFDGHMTGDLKSYVFRTTDLGKTWQALATPDLKGYVHVVKEDLVNRDLLFVGTEFGLFISVDGGRQWGQYSSGLANVAVRDIAIHPRDHDVILATHGRSLYVIDDITPLRKLTPAILDADAAFLDVRPQVMVNGSMDFGFNGDGEFVGQSPSEAAFITYYLKKRHLFGDLRIEVSDSTGKLLASIQGGKRKGINRVEWPMRSKPPQFAAGSGIIPNLYALMGPRAPEGTYTVRLIKGKDAYTTQIRLVSDPRSKATAAGRQVQGEVVGKLFALVERSTYVIEGITDARDQATARASKLAAADPMRKRLEAYAARMEKQRTALVATSKGEGISGDERLREELGTLYGNVNGFDGRPTKSQIDRMAVLAAELDAGTAEFDTATGKDLVPLNQELAKKKLDPIVKLTPEAWARSKKQ
ncbi:MAG TPA: hypothetical protein VGK32_05215 [Vicinamibacterales bacterium]|jgi:photosystem II stability/assembly factor-like uncharacterized protein